jgi:group II intron reverse transcriptase/maturase
MPNTQGREINVQTSIQAIAKKAENQPGYRFQNLYGMLNEEMLKDSWRYIRKNAAYGVDRVSAEDYEQNLDENIHQLVENLKQKRYRAKLVRRRYIPKGNGKVRPLGIPATEDKLLQIAVKRILEAIYEQDFLECSYGYRPNVGALDAVDKLSGMLQFWNFNYVVEADIKGFFDNIDHEWLLKMLAERIDDKSLMWLIKKWLKAGVLDTDGEVIHPETGSPQGGIISPILANIYLHYALDVWFEKVVKQHCNGKAYMVRFADDFVCAFENQKDAQRFYEVLSKRLGKFGLEISTEKTRIFPFSQKIKPRKTSFDFLGFEFRWGKDRAGKPRVKKRTARKNLRNSLKRFNLWCKENRHLRLAELFEQLNAKLRGYYNYFGIIGNFQSLQQFYYQAMRLLYKSLNRRSQHSSYNGAGYKQLIEQFEVVQPHIIKKTKHKRQTSLVPGMV